VVNARIVNAGSSYFRRRIFANILPFWAEFRDFRIRLNIPEDSGLTNIAART
jgi:hypothetical protein